MKDRIKQLMVSLNMNQQSFAEALDISPASLSSIFNDRTKPTLNHIDAIKNKFPTINLDWLLYGNGSMFIGDEIPANTNPRSNNFQESLIDFSEPVTDNSSAMPASSSSEVNLLKETSQMVEMAIAKKLDKKLRKITEIRVFYDDQTWETFVPKV